MSSIGNDAGVETDLITYDLLANSLNEDFSYLEIDSFGTLTNNPNRKQIRFYFGSDLLFDTGNVVAQGTGWWLSSKIIRINNNSQKTITKIVSDATLMAEDSFFVLSTQDLSNNIIIKTTGESSAADNITQEGLIIKWFK
jgi:hypothetical protein